MFNLKKKYLILFQVLFSISLLTNCSNNTKSPILEELSDTKVFNKGQSFLKDNDYKKAAIEFDKIYLNYPFSTLASNAEIMTAYSLFQDNQMNKAIGKLEEFIEMNPAGTKYRIRSISISHVILCSSF